MRRFTTDDKFDGFPIWSRDDRFILYFSFDDKTGGDLWVLPLFGDRKPYPFVASRFSKGAGQFSPDARWVAYFSNESGQNEIYLRPFPPGLDRRQWPVSTAGGLQARWRHDGRELYYVAPDRTLMAVSIAVVGDRLETGHPVALFKTRIYGVTPDAFRRQQYDVSADGRFLINVIAEEASGSPITVVVNWTAGLKK